MTARTLGFTLGSEGGRTAARFQCVECGNCLPVTIAGNLNPEAVAKSASRQGWTCHPFRKAGTYCPKCTGPRPKNDPNSELKKVVSMTVTPIVRDPTPEQRVLIRGHLDKSFDDAAGRYLDGMSDQRVAELVGVPRAAVEKMREAAYGPIKEDPEVALLRTETSDLRETIVAQQRVLDGLTKKVNEVAARADRLAGGKAA